jgi:cation diffusion facilitator family transporter
MSLHARTVRSQSHDHVWGVDEQRGAERRTRVVVVLTAATMAVEIAAGLAFGSMALLADGWHMATHASALTIAAIAYRHARRHARDARYSFGTGKVASLAGFGGAVALSVVALLMVGESAWRLAAPVEVRYAQAIPVAVAGLLVNLVSAWILRERPEGRDGAAPDHNLRAAYLHVLADALTSVLAIGALLAGSRLGWRWVDPASGIVGAVLVARWSYGLLRDAGAVLLDAHVSPETLDGLRRSVEADADNRVADLHAWRVGPRHLAAIVSVVTHDPRDPAHYKRLLSGHPELVHVTVEVNRCADEEACPPSAR